jgi:hypothetical protein
MSTQRADFHAILDPEEGLRMGEFRHSNPDLAGYAETCN